MWRLELEVILHLLQFMEQGTWLPNGEDPKLFMLSLILSEEILFEVDLLDQIYFLIINLS